MPGILDTPQKARILGAIQWAEHQRTTRGTPYSQSEIAKLFNCSQVTVRRIKASGKPRTNPSIFGETRGRKRKLTHADCQSIEQLYDEYPEEAPDWPWTAQLMNSVCEKEATRPTIRRAMRKYGNYGKYVAEVKQYTPANICTLRCSYCRKMLEEYDQSDFLTFRYSDESHFSNKQKAVGRRYISRKRGQRYEPRNLREDPAPEEPTDEKVHCWACIGYGFKSPLVRYRAGNQNGKMTQKVYLEEILQPHVGEWLARGENFVLEEDNDSGHGTSARNIVKTWKEEQNLRYFFNAPYSPDLTPIENVWRGPDSAVFKNARFCETSDDVMAFAEEGYHAVSQATINDWCRGVRQRYKDCLENGGRLVARERWSEEAEFKAQAAEKAAAEEDEDAEGDEDPDFEWPDRDQMED